MSASTWLYAWRALRCRAGCHGQARGFARPSTLTRPPAPLTGQRHARRPRQRSGDRGLHQLGDLLLDRGAPLLQRVRDRPQVPVVEVGLVLEAQGRVPVAELARVLEEDDD